MEKVELLEEKLEKIDGLSYSTATPPLYASSPSPQPPMSRSYTIPTPESSPSSCTSDVFHHSAFQSSGLHSPMSDLRTYTLPTPEVSPLEAGPRPLDYQTYGSLGPHPERFSFEGGSLSGECVTITSIVQLRPTWPGAGRSRAGGRPWHCLHHSWSPALAVRCLSIRTINAVDRTPISKKSRANRSDGLYYLPMCI